MSSRRRHHYHTPGRYEHHSSKWGWKEIAATGAVSLATTGLAHYLNVEEKFFDITFTDQPDNTGTIQWVTDIPQGDGGLERIGDSVKLTSIHFRSHISKQGVATIARFIVFIDKEWDNTGAAPQPSMILNTMGALPGGVISPLNRDNTKRFHILWDKVFTWHDVAATTTISGPCFQEFKEVDHHVNWAADGDGFTSIREGHVYLLTLSNIAPAGSIPTISTYFRLRFVDN